MVKTVGLGTADSRAVDLRPTTHGLTTHNSWTYDPQLIDLRPITHGLTTHNSWAYGMKVLSFFFIKAMFPTCLITL